MNMEPYANGVIEFTDQNPYVDFVYCLDDGCYMLTLEGLGVGMTELFEPGVQMNGLSVVQDVNIINDNLIEVVFGVNSNCVDGISDTPATEISIYPNPASNLLSVRNSNGEKIELIELWDGSGRLILTKPFSNQLDVSQIASGTYMVRVTSSNKTKVLPLQIHH